MGGEGLKKFLKAVIFLLFFVFIMLIALGLLIGDHMLPIAGLVVFAVASGLATIYLVMNQA